MHQIDYNDAKLNTNFEVDVDDEENHIPEPKERDEHNVGRRGGPKSILEKFPDIPVIASEYIKSRGFKARERRRDTKMTSCGVSVQDIREHLLKVVPALKEYGGISVTSVRYLFKPVRKGTFVAENY